MGSVLSVKVSIKGVPEGTVVMSKFSTELTDPSSVQYDDGELGFQDLPSDALQHGHTMFRPMSSTAIIQGSPHSLAVLSPSSVGICSEDTGSITVALYDRPRQADPHDHGGEFSSSMWIALSSPSSPAHLQLVKMLRHPQVMAYSPAPTRKIWRNTFQGLFQPLTPPKLRGMSLIEQGGTGLLDPRIHVLTAQVRDATLDSAVIRFVNTAEASASIKLDLQSFFKGMKLNQWKPESLALSFRNDTDSEEEEEEELWSGEHAVLSGRTVQTFSALFDSAQPFDYTEWEDEDFEDQRDVPTDVSGEKIRDYKPNLNADRAWLQSRSLSENVDTKEFLTKMNIKMNEPGTKEL